MINTPSLLDHCIWEALTAEQASLALGDHWARRFPADIGPLAGILEQSITAYASLAKLYRPGEQLVLFLDEPPRLPTGWTLDVGGMLTQMVYTRQSAPTVQNSSFAETIAVLTQADVPDMLALTKLTQPGPFRDNTITLGTYLGIRQNGQLIAMAGERLQLPGFTEVSAVCTHPEHQGKGLAKALTAAMVQNIVQRGKVPFLHSRPDNTKALRAYQALGFEERREVYLAVLRPETSPWLLKTLSTQAD